MAFTGSEEPFADYSNTLIVSTHVVLMTTTTVALALMACAMLVAMAYLAVDEAR